MTPAIPSDGRCPSEPRGSGLPSAAARAGAEHRKQRLCVQAAGVRAKYDKLVADMMQQRQALQAKQLELQKRLKDADVRPSVSRPPFGMCCAARLQRQL